MRSLFLVPFLCFSLVSLVACGGGAADAPDQQAPGGGGGGGPGGGGGGGPGGGGGGNPAVFAFDDEAIDLGRPGAFPSDLVRAPDGTAYTVDDAAVPATVLGFSPGQLAGAPALQVPIGAADLVDHDGTSPARSVTTFGTGLFGAFTGDLELALGRWLLVTVGAGNSFSTDDQGDPLRLANLVVIDTQTAQVVQTVNLAWPMQFNGSLSNGGPFEFMEQSLPVMAAFVPSRQGGNKGTVYVAMSNGAGTNAGLTIWFNGTVQTWRADFDQPTPLTIDATGKAPSDITRTFVSNHYNPVGLTGHTNDFGFGTLVLTNAGASIFDASFVAQPTTDAVLEFLDLETEQWRDTWTINLGRTLPAPQTIALGEDGNGLTFGVLASQTFAAAYVVDLTGLESAPVNPAALRFLRTVELEAGGAATAGSGFQPGVAVSPGGGTAAVTSFATGSLTLLGLPDDIEFGPIELNPAPFDQAPLGPASSSLGALVFDGSQRLLFLVNGTFDANFLPDRPAFLGTFTVTNASIP